jgi:tRNA-Thr(GGU) m(6)t(6)A37 methyltransferase TsaA
VRGRIVINCEYVKGLKDLSGFSHIILLYHFHRCTTCSLEVIPFLDTVHRGVFSTRSPQRPNKIGMSCVRLISVEDNVLTIEDVDVLDGTPLLDIKPYVPKCDSVEGAGTGWLEDTIQKVEQMKSDERFR